MAAWAVSNDPILTRYGVGALARLVTADAAAAATVSDAGGVRALTSALSSADGQAQCYAAKAVGARQMRPVQVCVVPPQQEALITDGLSCLSCAGALASSGGASARQLPQFGAPEQLLAALEKVRACNKLGQVYL